LASRCAAKTAAAGSAGNVWVSNRSGDSVVELNSSGALVGNFHPAGANFKAPNGMALDSAGNAWVTNLGGNSVTELNSSAALVGNFHPAGANFNSPDWEAVDSAGNLWITNFNGDTVAALIGLAAPVLTPLQACLKKTPATIACKP
jgi:streptogramin lyase